MYLQRWRLICVFAVISLFHGICNSEKAPDYTFVHDAVSAPSVSFHDYIVIGGGTSGCPLAATLSQGATVLVLERGGSPYGNRNIENMANFAASIADASPNSPSQQFVSEDGVVNTRARVLGGGSALNAGFFTRASKDYVKEASWDEKLVEESYEWVERKVAFKPPVLAWQSAVRDGLIEAGVTPDNGFTYEHLFGTKTGGTIFDGSGHRHTAANLLEYAQPNSTAVYLFATVHKILFSTVGERSPRAYGVIFEDKAGRMHGAYLRKESGNEIIVSAGAMGSPQVLMLSGIGPMQQLKDHGLKVLLDQPMVGQGMADNPMNALLVPSRRPVEVSLIQVVGITRFGSFIETISGSGFVYQTGQPQMTPPPVRGYVNMSIRGGIILEKIDGPISKGHLELRTTNPKDNPSVTFNYFKDPEDLRKCVLGMKTIIDVLNSQAMSSFRYDDMPVEDLISMMLGLPVNLRPHHPTAAISLEQFCIDTVMTIWHYHGGCQVGSVVDRDYKVIGVDSLRVVDGSTFNASPGTNPQATVMMLGRYMGQKLLQERAANRVKTVK
ncbi:protein HOTHEAD-like [Syzygium oleosum]|uniref:protein HOTHEAD-like n=1 Tax=Syzygium oleosum TaxID=219896 RepID=UPI0024B9D12B|nr:protein HOTHEAD-like [Syzygium oleosum]